jgi:hypothetical protein
MSGHSKTAWQGVIGHNGTTAGAGTRQRSAPPASQGITVNVASAAFLRAAERGAVRDRYERPFSDDAVRELRWCLTGHVADRLGATDLRKVRRRDIEGIVDELATEGISRRRQRAVVKSLRALYDYAIERDLVSLNPAERVALPDENDAEQPTRGRPAATPWRRVRIGFDRVLALGLWAATACFALLALFFIAESM